MIVTGNTKSGVDFKALINYVENNSWQYKNFGRKPDEIIYNKFNKELGGLKAITPPPGGIVMMSYEDLDITFKNVPISTSSQQHIKYATHRFINDKISDGTNPCCGLIKKAEQAAQLANHYK